MIQIEFKAGSDELAKVLHYYGLLEDSSEYKIVCPFHGDVNPSMKIDLVTGTFFCFGCNASGNALNFVMYANPKLDDLEACLLYFKILKSKKVKQIKAAKGKGKIKQDNKLALAIAHDYYYGLKTIDWTKIECPEKAYMNKRGFNDRTLNACKAKLTYNDSYPIVFPMLDMGSFRGWVCRTDKKLIEKKRKYLYNEGFSRTNTLVGEYDSKAVMLVEGYMDSLKAKQYGVKKVAAILGWKITGMQIAKLKEQGVEYIISALDNDECGKKGTKYLKQFFKVVRFQYPEGIKDPGEMTKEQFIKANNKTKQLYRREISK